MTSTTATTTNYISGTTATAAALQASAANASSTTAAVATALSHRIAYSGISGAIATTCIYPLDIVKTKLQSGLAGISHGNVTQMNANGATVEVPKKLTPISVARFIAHTDGYTGFYRGWPPNVVFVMPEKAIKITANDLFRERIRNMRTAKDLPLYCEMIAGGSAGLCQVVMTNPMELLKIQGATMRDKIKAGTLKEAISYPKLIRQLGISGLYTGVLSTLMRDIPFSMIYFPAYAQVKSYLANGNTSNFSFQQSLTAGAIAGTLAAASTCPMDVIKTRVHENAKPMKMPFGEFLRREVALIPLHYNNILQEGGYSALFRGIVPRCIIITPLFAITMGFYDFFQSRLG